MTRMQTNKVHWIYYPIFAACLSYGCAEQRTAEPTANSSVGAAYDALAKQMRECKQEEDACRDATDCSEDALAACDEKKQECDDVAREAEEALHAAERACRDQEETCIANSTAATRE